MRARCEFPLSICTRAEAGIPAVADTVGDTRPATVAVSDCPPMFPPSVHDVLAAPLASDTELAGDAKPPPFSAATVQLTVVPATALPYASATVTATGDARAVPAEPFCAPPPVSVTIAGAPDLAVAVNVALSRTKLVERIATALLCGCGNWG